MLLVCTDRQLSKIKNNNKYIRFQSDTTVSYYSPHWQQVTIIRP